MTSSREIFVSVDVETSGPIPGEYSLLSIGACDAYDERRTFSCLLKPTGSKADPEALAVSGLDLATLGSDGLDALEAMDRFRSWLDTLGAKDDKLVFVGLNTPFDWSFVNYYMHRFGARNPFGFTALDIKALYMGVTGCDWSASTSKRMASHLHAKRRGDHDALHDALYQAELFRLIREIVVDRSNP